MSDGETIKYATFDGSDVLSFIAGKENSDSAVLVIHEIWGLTNFIKNYSRKISELGFMAFAPHLYSRKDVYSLFSQENISGAMKLFFEVPPDKRTEKEFIEKTMRRATTEEREVISRLLINRAEMEKTMIKDLSMAYQYLKNELKVKKIGVVGFCMGGGLSFQISTQLPFDATVVYYGANPKNLDDIANIKGPVLAVYAGNDDGINSGVPDMVRSFIKFGKQIELKIYPGTRHAFANTDGFAFNKYAADDSWNRVSAFFTKYLR
jgi:carboxymethylenebutenolidase